MNHGTLEKSIRLEKSLFNLIWLRMIKSNTIIGPLLLWGELRWGENKRRKLWRHDAAAAAPVGLWAVWKDQFWTWKALARSLNRSCVGVKGVIEAFADHLHLHTNLSNTLKEREHHKMHNRASLNLPYKCFPLSDLHFYQSLTLLGLSTTAAL